MDKETATTMVVKMKRLMCPDCGHRHRQGQYCHVYVEASEDYESEAEEEENGSDDDSDDSIGYNKMKPNSPKKQQEVALIEKPLTTPVRILVFLCLRSCGFSLAVCSLHGIRPLQLRYRSARAIETVRSCS